MIILHFSQLLLKIIKKNRHISKTWFISDHISPLALQGKKTNVQLNNNVTDKHAAVCIKYSATTYRCDTRHTEAKIMYQMSGSVCVVTTHNTQMSRVTVQGVE